MAIKKELYEIICEQEGCDINCFTISKYLRKGWMCEDDLLNAIKTLIKRNYQRKVTKRWNLLKH